MVTHTFTCPVSPERFVAWITKKCSAHVGIASRFDMSDPMDEQQTISFSRFIPYEDRVGSGYRLTWLIAKAQGNEYHEQEAISFHVDGLITELANSRITAQCNFTPAMPYFEYLLGQCGQALKYDALIAESANDTLRLAALFDGTPAAFYEIMKEFSADSFAEGKRIVVELTDPVRTVEHVDNLRMAINDVRGSLRGDRLIDRITPTYTQKEPAITADSLGCVIEVWDADLQCEFQIAARPYRNGKTPIVARRTAPPDISTTWQAIMRYLDTHGWLAKDDANSRPGKSDVAEIKRQDTEPTETLSYIHKDDFRFKAPSDFHSTLGDILDIVVKQHQAYRWKRTASQFANWRFAIWKELKQVVELSLSQNLAGWELNIEWYQEDQSLAKVIYSTLSQVIKSILNPEWARQEVSNQSKTEDHLKNPKNVPSDERELKQAIYDLKQESRTPAWWKAVAELFWTYKRVNPKFTYASYAALLGYSDDKYVGERMREHRPPKTT